MSSSRLRLAGSLLRSLVELSGEPLDGSIDAAKFRLQRRFHPRRLALTESDASNGGTAVLLEAELTRDTAVNASLKINPIDLGSYHSLVTGPRCGPDVTSHNARCHRPCQGDFVRRKPPEVLSELATRIKVARTEILALSQNALAKRLEVDQSNISRWEKSIASPEPEHLLKLAMLLPGRVEGLWFIEAAGVPQEYLDGTGGFSSTRIPTEFWTLQAAERRREALYVPLLRDAAALGTPRALDDGEIESFIPIDKTWAPSPSALMAIRFNGESMAPLIADGAIVIVDTTRHDPRRLVDRIVAVRDQEGLTIKRIRRHGDALMLVPQNADRFPIVVLRPNEGWSIVGMVVNWISFAAPGKL